MVAVLRFHHCISSSSYFSSNTLLVSRDPVHQVRAIRQKTKIFTFATYCNTKIKKPQVHFIIKNVFDRK